LLVKPVLVEDTKRVVCHVQNRSIFIHFSLFILFLLNYPPCLDYTISYQPSSTIYYLPSPAMSYQQTDQTKYKLCYFVPPSSLQVTKDAIFSTNLAGIFSSLTDANKTLYTDVVSRNHVYDCVGADLIGRLT
jgi:hypothetical protein